MKFRKVLAFAVSLCLVCGGVQYADIMPVNFYDTLTASAVESGIVKSGKTSDGILYDIYGTYENVYNEKIKDTETKLIKKENVVVTGYEGTKSSVKVPAEIESTPVTAIGDNFLSCKGEIASVALPDTLETIGDHAFAGCSSLTSITIPDSVEAIGENAFDGCGSLIKIKLSKNLSSVSPWMFHGCTALTSIDIPESVTSIGEYAFASCEAMTKITIPDSVLSIKYGAFDRCGELLSVKLPQELISISDSLFFGCASLTTVEIPDGVSVIGERAFWGCTSLGKINVPKNAAVIKKEAFAFSGLTEFAFPDGTAVLNDNVLYGCENLRTVTIPDSVEKINDGAFSNTPALINITVPENVKKMGGHCFGYYEYELGLEEWEKYENVSVTGKKGSAAEKYAADNGITFLTAADIFYGDTNCDGKISVADAALILQYLGNGDKYKLSEQGKKNADVCGNDGISALDALIIQMVDAGLINKSDLPVDSI